MPEGCQKTDRWMGSEQRTPNCARARSNLVASTRLAQMLSLNFEEAGFNCGGATQAPQQTGQPEYQFPLHGRMGVVVSGTSSFEGFVVLGTLQRTDHRLGRQSMADSIAA